MQRVELQNQSLPNSPQARLYIDNLNCLNKLVRFKPQIEINPCALWEQPSDRCCHKHKSKLLRECSTEQMIKTKEIKVSIINQFFYRTVKLRVGKSTIYTF